MRKIFVFILFSFFSIVLLVAQDLENIAKQKPFQLHGALGFNYTGTMTNDSNRIPMPNFWSANVNLTASVYGFSIPFSAVLTNGKMSVANSFNQFGLSPTYKWLTLHGGYRQYSYSPFTVAGQTFLGGGFELRPWFLRLGLFGGRLRKAYEMDSTLIFQQNIPGSYPLNISTVNGQNFYSTQTSYSRWGWGSKLGFGKDNNYVDFIFFKGYDSPNSLKNQKSKLHLAPEENIVLGLNIFQRFAKHFSLGLNGAASVYTFDATANPIEDDFEMKELVNKLIPITPTTQFQWAAEANFNISYPNFTLNTTYKRVQPNFRSMGINSYLTDMSYLSIQPSWSMAKQRIRFMNMLQFQSDNLNGYKMLTSKRKMINSSVSLNLSNNFGLDINFNHNNLSQQKAKASVPDSVHASQKSNSFTFSPRYVYGSSKLSSATSLITSFTKMNNTIPGGMKNDIQNIYATLNNTLMLMSSGWNFTGGLNYNSAKTSLNNLQSYGFVAGISKSVLDNKLSLSNSNTLLWNVLDGKPNGNTYSIDLNGFYNFHPKHSVNFALGYLYSPANGVYNIRDFSQTRIMLGYQYRF